MTTAAEALQRLIEGNRRFTSEGASGVLTKESTREALKGGQAPFAVILGCSDSRVAPELLFDQGLGELFVIRVAGHVVCAPALESVELAVSQLGAKLVVVLGHSRCAAVRATLEEVQTPGTDASSQIASVIDHIRPSVEAVLKAADDREQDALMGDAVRTNVRVAVSQLREDSALLKQGVQSGDVLVLGAEYSLDTGCVDFFEGLHD